MLGLAILVGAGLLLWKPTWVEEVRTTLHEHTALTFAVGILVNALALAIIGVLSVAFTRPPALLMGLACWASIWPDWPPWVTRSGGGSKSASSTPACRLSVWRLACSCPGSC